MIWFVNQVATAVEKGFPDKYIGTLANVYTRTPPNTIHPRNNVVVRLCSIECCFSHCFHSCAMNNSILKDLEAWGKIAPQMYIWNPDLNYQELLNDFIFGYDGHSGVYE